MENRTTSYTTGKPYHLRVDSTFFSSILLTYKTRVTSWDHLFVRTCNCVSIHAILPCSVIRHRLERASTSPSHLYRCISLTAEMVAHLHWKRGTSTHDHNYPFCQETHSHGYHRTKCSNVGEQRRCCYRRCVGSKTQKVGTCGRLERNDRTSHDSLLYFFQLSVTEHSILTAVSRLYWDAAKQTP